MSGPFDISSLGANYFTSLQAAATAGAQAATYGPAFTSVPINISAALTQMCNLSVPASKTRVILAATVTAAGGSLLEYEITIDGAKVIAGSQASASGANYIVGASSFANAGPTTVSNLQANSNITITAKNTLTTAVLTLWYIDRD